MFQSVYDLVNNLIGHTWQYAQQYVQYSEQPYIYTTACVIVVLLVIVGLDLIYRFFASLFNFRL